MEETRRSRSFYDPFYDPFYEQRVASEECEGNRDGALESKWTRSCTIWLIPSTSACHNDPPTLLFKKRVEV